MEAVLYPLNVADLRVVIFKDAQALFGFGIPQTDAPIIGTGNDVAAIIGPGKRDNPGIVSFKDA